MQQQLMCLSKDRDLTVQVGLAKASTYNTGELDEQG